MSSGACVPMILEKENAVEDFRKLIGATNPEEAEEGTIRAAFADSLGENIIHGSDSVENGKLESAYFFSESEVVAVKIGRASCRERGEGSVGVGGISRARLAHV